MRCNICDKELSDKEVVYNEELKAYEPCTVCIDIAMDAAYSDGYQHEDEDTILLGDFDVVDLGDGCDIVPRAKEDNDYE